MWLWIGLIACVLSGIYWLVNMSSHDWYILGACIAAVWVAQSLFATKSKAE
jgi:hypothetical protein